MNDTCKVELIDDPCYSVSIAIHVGPKNLFLTITRSASHRLADFLINRHSTNFDSGGENGVNVHFHRFNDVCGVQVSASNFDITIDNDLANDLADKISAIEHATPPTVDQQTNIEKTFRTLPDKRKTDVDESLKRQRDDIFRGIV